MTSRPLRAMWLLNHTAARRFEVPMLKRAGIAEVFLPKIFPPDHNFRSASIDWSEDQLLTIPSDELAILNGTDWYGIPSAEAWSIANRHFDILFFIFHREEQVFRNICSHFAGAIVWRAYGLLQNTVTYSGILDSVREGDARRMIQKAGRRFWFGEAYPHLHEQEDLALQDRTVYLPLGLPEASIKSDWSGIDRRIYFVCPEIGSNPYYQKVYSNFTAAFGDFQFAVSGVQPIVVNDPRILGFVPAAEHERNMREFRVMLYTSSEPTHIHFHPFEAIRCGMPLIFMGGGILDRFGGKDQPGRCESIEEARGKLERVLGDDLRLIKRIRENQVRLLDPVREENCLPAWKDGISKILRSASNQDSTVLQQKRKTRVAVLLPIGYRGGSLTGAKLIARAIEMGSQQADDPVEVVFAHVDDPSYSDADFVDLPPSIKRRSFTWKRLNAEQAYRAMAFAGLAREMKEPFYLVPDDGITQFQDCSVWVVVSDRLTEPLLPIKPYALMVYDYLQRYVPQLAPDVNLGFFAAAHGADRIFVTTEFSRRDAMQYAGLPDRRVITLPMLIPIVDLLPGEPQSGTEHPYFVWSTNLAVHKNHEAALDALRLYYEKYDGKLRCRITGVGSDVLFSTEIPHLKALAVKRSKSPALKRNLSLLGDLPDFMYWRCLAGSQFLWHPALIDNGTFSVIQAAQLRVPALSNRYPAMDEIHENFGIDVTWMDSRNSEDMAVKLKWMEKNAPEKKAQLPDRGEMWRNSMVGSAAKYWSAVRDCL